MSVGSRRWEIYIFTRLQNFFRRFCVYICTPERNRVCLSACLFTSKIYSCVTCLSSVSACVDVPALFLDVLHKPHHFHVEGWIQARRNTCLMVDGPAHGHESVAFRLYLHDFPSRSFSAIFSFVCPVFFLFIFMR